MSFARLGHENFEPALKIKERKKKCSKRGHSNAIQMAPKQVFVTFVCFLFFNKSSTNILLNYCSKVIKSRAVGIEKT